MSVITTIPGNTTGSVVPVPPSSIPLANGKVLIGNASNVAAAQSVSGDVTISNAGVTTIGAGKVTEAMQVLADNTTNNVSTSKHGYAPKLPNDATKYLDGTGNYTVPAGGGGGATVVETVGSGTDYTLTTTPTLVAFGGGNLELTIADAGTYDVEIGVFEDLSGVTASAGANGAFVMAALDTGGGYGAPFALRVTSSIPILAAAVLGITGKSSYFARGGLSGVVCGAGDKIGVLAATAGAVTGSWVLKADQTSGACSYIRATKVA